MTTSKLHPLMFGLRVFLLMGLFLIMWRLLFVYYPPASVYDESIIIAAVIGRPTSLIVLALTFTLLLANYLPIPQNFFRGHLCWEEMQAGHALRGLVLGASAIMAWYFSTYDVNLYFDQFHALDRLLLLIIWALIFLNPAFLLPFLFVLFTIARQFEYPSIFFYSWTDKLLVANMLLLMVAFIVQRLLVRERLSVFVFTALCLVASHYVLSGIAKLSLDTPLAWFQNNQLDRLFVVSHANGWLAFLPDATILNLAQVVAYLNLPIKILTILIELGAIFIIVRHQMAKLLTVGFILLHIGIVLSSGIFFWKWILLDIALIWFVWQPPVNAILRSFERPFYIVFSFVVILLGCFVFRAPSLGWFDTGLDISFDVEVEQADGTIARVSRLFFAPYDIVFAQSRFYFTLDERVPIDAYGTTHQNERRQQIDDIVSVLNSKDDVTWQVGRNFYDPVMVSNFASFLETWFHNHNDRIGSPDLPDSIRAPKHIQSQVARNRYNDEREVRVVRVIVTETAYTGDAIIELNRAAVLEVDIQE